MAYVFDQARINQLHQRWTTMRVTRQHTEIAFEAESIIHHRAIYEEAEKETGVPWYMIGVIDSREGGVQELGKRHLANGDSLLWFTRQVPQGRPVILLPNGHRKPPPFTWLESAIDSLKYQKLTNVTDWTIEHILHLLEPYNGLGYFQLGHPSPYIWSCTTVYDPPNGPGGKYIRDHVYDPHAVDSQVGCAPLLAEIARQGDVTFTSHFDSAPPQAPTVKGMFGKITADAHVLPAQRRRLGKKSARPVADKHWWSNVFKAAKFEEKLGPVPAVFGHVDDTTPVPMLGNDRAGDCAWCTIAHLTMVRELAAGKQVAPFTDKSVLAEYSAATGYSPNDPATDQGSDMQDVAAWWKATGIHDADGTTHKVDFFAFVKVGDLDELAQAAYYCGGVAMGLNLPASAEKQFDEHVPWTVDAHSKIAGGHAVALVGRNSAGNWVIATWDGLQAVTDDFVRTYMDEGFVGVSTEYLTAKGVTPEGLTEQQEEQAS